MRFTSLFIIASTLLSIVFSLPVSVPKDQSLGTPSLARRFEVESNELLDRDISGLFRRAKVTLSKHANKELDDLGLQGKERRKAIAYHSRVIRSQMKDVPGAHTAEISHIAHVGGSDRNEPLHATVVFRRKPSKEEKDKKKLVIDRTYRDSAGIEQTVQLHHVYPKAEHKMPKAYADAERNRAAAKGFPTHSIV